VSPDELQRLWKSGGEAGAGVAWTPARVAALRSSRSRSVTAFVRRLLAADLLLKAVAAISLGVAAWLARRDAVGAITALAGLAVTAGLAVLVARAGRVFPVERSLDGDVRTVTRALLADLARFRRATAPAVAATGSLLLLAWLVGYFAVEYGTLRHARADQWAVNVLLLATPFVARLAVVRARLRAATTALSACLEELDPDAFAAIGREDRRALRALLVAVLLVLGLLCLGVVLYLAA
jgi:hypothetical protein